MAEYMEFDTNGSDEDVCEFDLDSLEDAGFDVETALSYSAYDEDIYCETLQAYLDSGAEKFNSLKGFYEAGDWKEYEILVHSIKSNSKTVGAMDVSGQALALEEAAERQDEDFISQNHDSFMEAYRKALHTINEAREV